MSIQSEPIGPVHAKVSLIRPLALRAAGSDVDLHALTASLALAIDFGDEKATIPLTDYYRLQAGISAALKDETFHLSERKLLSGTTDFVLGHLLGATLLYGAMKTLA